MARIIKFVFAVDAEKTKRERKEPQGKKTKEKGFKMGAMKEPQPQGEGDW